MKPRKSKNPSSQNNDDHSENVDFEDALDQMIQIKKRCPSILEQLTEIKKLGSYLTDKQKKLVSKLYYFQVSFHANKVNINKYDFSGTNKNI